MPALTGTLVSRIRAQADRFPEKSIVRFLGDEDENAEVCLSYAEIDRSARAIAAQLQAMGASGERALILHAPGVAYVTALLGCFYAGAVAVPAYPLRYRTLPRLRAIIADAGARFALTTAGAIERMEGHIRSEPAFASLTWLASDRAEESGGDDWRAPTQDAAAIALLQYTSGSTAAPRGVCLSHANFLDNIAALSELRGDRGDDRIVSWLPPYHDMGLICGILMPLCTGIETTLMAPGTFLRRPFRWLSAITRYGGTISGGPNFAFELCLRRMAAPEQVAMLDLSRWRVAFCGAERVRADTLDRFATAFAGVGLRRSALTPCYGLAEATVAVAFGVVDAGPKALAVDPRALGEGRAESARPGQPVATLLSCGRPVAGCEVIIVDPVSRLALADDRVGEIWVRSPSVASGYWQQAQLSESTFHARLADMTGAVAHDYLCTGDLGFLHDGELFVAGRIKDLIVVRGINHYPEDFESTAQACDPHLRIGGGAAFGIDDHGEERLVVVHEVDAVSDAPLYQIAAAIRGAIAEAQEVAVYDVVLVAPGAVPKTSSGKVQRSRCRDLYLGGQLQILARAGAIAASQPAGSPAIVAAELIDRVGHLMADLLGVKTVSAADDFFWLGGHSLMATQLVSRIRERFAVDLPLRAVFEAPTPAQLAARIAAAPRVERLPPIEAADRSQPLLLSFSQERMWLLHQLDPRSAAYNVAGAVVIDGVLAISALRRAFDEMPKRHEVLRTRYPTVDGEPRVRIATAVGLPLPLDDMSDRADPRAAALAAASALAHEPFDIAAGPLLRAALYRLAPERHLLCVCMHHLVTDAWSMGLFVADLLRCYDRFAAGAEPAPAAETLTYIDYAQWQRRHMGDEYLAAQLAYWKTQLEGFRPLELPSDRSRLQPRSSAGAFLPLALRGELLQSLNTLAAAQGTTLFMMMLAAFEVLLYRYTGADDLVVGIPVANRNRLASESLMGSLVNTLPLRLRFDGDMSFSALLRQLRETVLDAYAQQDLPFERLVAALPVARRTGTSPIVSVMFDFQNAPMPGRAEGPLRMRPVVLSRGAAQFDLSLLIFDTDLGRSAGIEYSTDLFDEDAMRRLLGHYVAILETIVLNPTVTVSRIPLLGGAEREALLASSRGDGEPAAAVAASVPAGFAAQARRAPRAPALVDERGSLSYAELDRRSALLAGRLVALGAGPGERVAVCLERDRELPIALLAVLRSGAAYVPLDPRHPPDRVGFILQDSAPRVVVTQEKLRANLPLPLSAICLSVDDVGIASESEPELVTVPEEARAAYVIYTSGSTGRPKGVEVPMTALANFLRSIGRRPGMNAGDRLLSVTTIAFDIAGLELWLPLVNGACVRLISSEDATDPVALLRVMRDWQPTIMQATPTTWKMLIDAGWGGDPDLRILCGGEALAPELARELLVRGQSVWNMYGPTETTIWSTLHRVRSDDGPSVPIGRPIEETSIYILDRHGELLPRGVPGEIHIGGSGVATGYFRRPELTRERFAADPFTAKPDARMYRSGDGGRMRGDGTFEYLGRLDNQIKLRGFRIEPGEIEAALKENSRIRDAVVIAREDRPGDQRLVAYYLPARTEGGADIPRAELLEPLQRRLPSYMIPSAFVALASFPQTPNGKIDRRRLPSPRFDEAADDDAYLAPRDALEEELVRLWTEILGVGRVGVRDDFFQIGGYSLLAARLFARIENRLGVVLPLSILIERPTVEYLAERIRREIAPDGAAKAIARRFTVDANRFAFVVPIQDRGRRPPLFCVHGAGGNVLNFSNLARYLGPDRPLFGVQARGVDGRTRPFAHVDEMAAAYLAELRALQPQGPYYLAGYCGGGIIAFEMARRLRAEGHAVALLALIDCYRPNIQTGTSRHRRWTSGVHNEGIRYISRKAAVKFRREYLVLSSRLRIGFYRLRRMAVPYELRDFWLTQAFLDSARRYRPGVYPGKVVILRATEVDPELLNVGPELGWSGLAAGGIQSFDVPGDHYSLLHEPNVRVLAAALERSLEAAERDAGT